jgi:hypothetical protein
MAFIGMHDRGIDPKSIESAQPAHAQQRVLGEANLAVALVQAGRDEALPGRVLRQLGVEEKQRHPSDLGPPDLHRHLLIPDRHLDGDGPAVLAGHQGARTAFGVGLVPVLMLPATAVHPLMEVTLPVQQPDAHHR